MFGGKQLNKASLRAMRAKYFGGEKIVTQMVAAGEFSAGHTKYDQVFGQMVREGKDVMQVASLMSQMGNKMTPAIREDMQRMRENHPQLYAMVGGGGMDQTMASPNSSAPTTQGNWGATITFVLTLFLTGIVILPHYHVNPTTGRLQDDTFCHTLFTYLATTVLPSSFLTIYDPMVDHTVNLTGIGALTGYYFMTMVCTLVDLCGVAAWKTQDAKSFFTWKQWCQAVAMSSFNIFFMGWPVMLLVWYMQKHGWFRSSSTPLTLFTDDFHWPTELLKQVAHVIIIDVWFFTTHRLIHVPVLYKWVHKFHHQFTAPCAPACMYANPLEFAIGNVMGIILGPCLTNCHPLLSLFWLTFSLVSTSATHSGYLVLGAQNHDWHHEHFNYNYGTNVFMDRLFGTKFIGSKRWFSVLKRKQKKAMARVAGKESESESEVRHDISGGLHQKLT
jgi:sterol desaturase/sphingolipid hydroxylase (fatty acid hydroxylase superfamily)